MTFLETVRDEFNAMRARSFAGEGYEGVTHAGIALVALDTGRVFLAKRAYDETDAEDVRETWEFPGGGLKDGEDPFPGAVREVIEETGWGIPDDSTVSGGWRSTDGVYQGFLVTTAVEFPVDGWSPTTEVSDIGWFDHAAVMSLADVGALRPEVRDQTDWAMIFEDGPDDEEDDMADDLTAVAAMTDEPPLMKMSDLDPGPIPIHGVLCPEDTESGDGRGFTGGSVTRRTPLRLPFGWQKVMKAGHEGAITIGSIDRMMRKDGMIHWEGSLLATPEAMEFFDLLVHFGKYGVSIDGDKGSIDEKRSAAEGMAWFDAVRIAGATACAVPAYQEAYASLGPHPDMPLPEHEDTMITASMYEQGELIGQSTFDRGPGWITNPKETKRIHDYWTKPGQPGYEKINWGNRGDYTRCVELVGEKIATNSPEDLRFIKRICAQWHHDALGYWPGDLDKPGNKTTEEARAERKTSAGLAINNEHGIEAIESTEDESAKWEAVLVSSVSGNRVRPPVEYFHRHPNTGATAIDDPDEHGFRRTYGYAGQWGVCHVGMDGRCVEPPRTGSDQYPEFHLGRTRVAGDGYISTGVLTYGVGHRDATTILNESAEQAYFDNVNNAWAAVRVGEDEFGIWYSGVVLPGVPEDHIVAIEASGQVSGEWKHGAMRACLTVNVPGYPVQRASAEFDENGNVVAMAASAFTVSFDINGVTNSECAPSPQERMAALRKIDAEERFSQIRDKWLAGQEG